MCTNVCAHIDICTHRDPKSAFIDSWGNAGLWGLRASPKLTLALLAVHVEGKSALTENYS